MVEEQTATTRSKLKSFAFKAIKATIKAVLFYLVYIFVWSFLAPLTQFVPDLQAMVETFVIVYITLMIIGELTAGTIFHYFFGAARALFVILYLILALQGGMIGMTYENVNLLIDMRMFVGVAMLLGLVGLAKSLLQAVNYMNERAELTKYRL